MMRNTVRSERRRPLLCMSVTTGMSCSFPVVVVVELARQRRVDIDLRQGWFGHDARGCFGPRRRGKHKLLLI